MGVGKSGSVPSSVAQPAKRSHLSYVQCVEGLLGAAVSLDTYSENSLLRSAA